MEIRMRRTAMLQMGPWVEKYNCEEVKNLVE